MHLLSAAAEAICDTTKKSEKVCLLADYLRARAVEAAAVSAVFFSGRAFPLWEETRLQVGGALLVRVVLEVSGARDAGLERAYGQTGDLGAAAGKILSWVGHTRASAQLDVVEVARGFRSVAQARGPAAKAALLRRLLERATPLEAKYLIKIITGELRIGLKQSLVEEAIAAAYGAPIKDVQRANMLLGDIGETLRLAASGELGAARMRLFHPLGFMLASPAESAEAAFASFHDAQIEEKYDGIRAQAHCAAHGAEGTGARDVRLFSRTLDDITESFPELVEPLRVFDGVILDGEVLAWDFRHGHALPFSELQKRLGRKKVTAAIMRAVPVAYVVFDILCANGELVIDRPLRERGPLLDKLLPKQARQDSRPRIADIFRYRMPRANWLSNRRSWKTLPYPPGMMRPRTNSGWNSRRYCEFPSCVRIRRPVWSRCSPAPGRAAMKA